MAFKWHLVPFVLWAFWFFFSFSGSYHLQMAKSLFLCSTVVFHSVENIRLGNKYNVNNSTYTQNFSFSLGPKNLKIFFSWHFEKHGFAIRLKAKKWNGSERKRKTIARTKGRYWISQIAKNVLFDKSKSFIFLFFFWSDTEIPMEKDSWIQTIWKQRKLRKNERN